MLHRKRYLNNKKSIVTVRLFVRHHAYHTKHPFNPLTANEELSRHGNLTFLWTWTLKKSDNPGSQRVKLQKKYENCDFFFTIFIFLFNDLTANDEISRHENLTLLWTWTLKWVPRSFTTHVPLYITLGPLINLSKNSENPGS